MPGEAAAEIRRSAARRRRTRLTQAFPEVEELFRAARERHQMPGIVYGVVLDGELVLRGASGLRRTVGEEPARPDTLFRIASMTKSVTATCLLMLRDEGLLTLERPVADYLPQMGLLRLPTSDSAPPTVRQLMTMAAGLVEDDPWADRHLDMEEEEFDALLRSGISFDLAPGLAFEYSNLGYGVLGRVVRELTGSSVMELASRRLFGPLGMRDSLWEVAQVPASRRAHGYRLEDGDLVEEPALAMGAFAPMGGLWTTVEDFGRYVAFQLSAWPARDDPDQGPLRRSSLREMQQPSRLCPAPQAKSPWLPGAGYGFGLISGESARDGRVVCHSGGLPGFGSHVQWLPDRGLGVFAFANLTYAPVRPVVAEAIDLLAASGALEAPGFAPSPALLEAFEGVRRLYEAWDQELARELAADNLFLDLTAEQRREGMGRLREEHGACLEAEQTAASGLMRGTWRMRCERGAVEVTIWLAPTIPPRIQVLRLSSAAQEETPEA